MSKQKQSVTIRSMGDLVELVNHNCDIFDRSIKKLTRNNRSLKLLCLVSVGCAIHAAIKNQQQEEELYKLSVRVDKLEHGEGA